MHKIDLSKESGHQYAVMLWSQQAGIRKRWPELALLHAIPNGGSRAIPEAAALKRTGVKTGVPDLHLPVPRGKFHSLYIEMKRPGGKPSESQKWWIEKLEQYGNLALLCEGWEEAVKCLSEYLSLPQPMDPIREPES